MAIRGRNVRHMWTEAGSRLGTFQSAFRKLLGIVEDPKTGRRYVDASARQMAPDEFSVRELTEAFLGHDFVSELHGGPPSGSRAQTLAMALNESTQARLLMEDVGAVGPSIFQDINAWNASIAGLIEVRLLESYNSEDFIADEFMETQPTRVNGGKMIGIPYVAPVADVVQPGVEFPNAGMNELYVWARPNMVYGVKLGLDRNTVVYDLGGELMSKAESVGAGLGYGKEYYCASNILGLSQPPVPANGYPKPSILQNIGNSFRMNATIDSTPNPTYQTAGVTTNPNLKNAYNYVNQQQNTLADWTSLQTARSLLNLMRDPVNILPFKTAITRLLVDPSNWDLANYILHQTQVFNVTGTPATTYGPLTQGAGSTFPPVMTGHDGHPPRSELNAWTPYKSNIWHQVWLDSGISEANAKKRWLAGDPKKAFVWRSAWDTRVDQANPSSSELLGRNIVNEWVCQWSGQFVVREPRYCVLNTE